MKIDKLSKNKIRIVLNLTEISNFKNSNNVSNISDENQNFLKSLLEKANNEVGFNTTGYKILVEVISSFDELLLIIITKYKITYAKSHSNNSISNQQQKKKSVYKHLTSSVIYSFKTFEDFLDFSTYTNSITSMKLSNTYKNVLLYFYNNTYYLELSHICKDYKKAKTFLSCISEFAELTNFSGLFNNKLLEHGNLVFNNNAITKCIKYF